METADLLNSILCRPKHINAPSLAVKNTVAHADSMSATMDTHTAIKAISSLM
jgi:hypothetical protein